MASTLNPDGTVSQFKIGEEEPINTTAKNVKLKKDGTPRKKMGPKKKYENERKVLSGYIDIGDHNELISDFGSGTTAIVKLIEMYKANKAKETK